MYIHTYYLEAHSPAQPHPRPATATPSHSHAQPHPATATPSHSHAQPALQYPQQDSATICMTRRGRGADVVYSAPSL